MTVNAFGYENDLVADLQRLLESVMAPIGEAVERYVHLQTRDFAQVEAELSFLLNGVTLIERLREAELPTCRPAIAPVEERVSQMDGAYSVSLALRMMAEAGAGQRGTAAAIVPNEVTFDGSHGRVWVLTGPNRGGKTTFVRAVGQAHLLFQAGLHVPAGAARLSPIDAIYTHFPARESASPGEGRLDDEAVRLAEIFRRATPRSFILLNEVLSGTSTVEALGLAYDAIRGLHLLGARAVYVTHLHELGTYVEEINASTDGDGVVGSLVAEIASEAEHGQPLRRRTFRIHPGPPLGLSYASEIAEQHGISYAQLVHLLRERGVVSEPAGDSGPSLTARESGTSRT
jgi:DNA mismatch repair ATPase MutS